MERTEQMYTIQKHMDFGKIKVCWPVQVYSVDDSCSEICCLNIPSLAMFCPQPFPLVSSSRWLQKRGELAVCTEELSIFGKTFSHKSYYLFLFNDVLIVTRKKR